MRDNFKISKKTRAVLEEIGNYRIVAGSRHLKIYVHGVMCGILPKNSRGDGCGRDERAVLNVISQIRRAARSITTQPNPAL